MYIYIYIYVYIYVHTYICTMFCIAFTCTQCSMGRAKYHWVNWFKKQY